MGLVIVHLLSLSLLLMPWNELFHVVTCIHDDWKRQLGRSFYGFCVVVLIVERENEILGGGRVEWGLSDGLFCSFVLCWGWCFVLCWGCCWEWIGKWRYRSDCQWMDGDGCGLMMVIGLDDGWDECDYCNQVVMAFYKTISIWTLWSNSPVLIRLGSLA